MATPAPVVVQPAEEERAQRARLAVLYAQVYEAAMDVLADPALAGRVARRAFLIAHQDGLP